MKEEEPVGVDDIVVEEKADEGAAVATASPVKGDETAFDSPEKDMPSKKEGEAVEEGEKVEPLQPAAVVLTSWFRVAQGVKDQLVLAEVETQKRSLKRLVHVKSRILAFLYLVQDKNERDWARKAEEK